MKSIHDELYNYYRAIYDLTYIHLRSLLLENKNIKSIIDLGCGEAFVSLRLLEDNNYIDVKGIDWDSSIKINQNNRFDLQIGDVFNYIHETKETYDLIIITNLIHELIISNRIKSEGISDFLEFLLKLSKQNGYVFIGEIYYLDTILENDFSNYMQNFKSDFLRDHFANFNNFISNKQMENFIENSKIRIVESGKIRIESDIEKYYYYFILHNIAK